MGWKPLADLPMILSWERFENVGLRELACLCICSARHPGRNAVCNGHISSFGVRVHFNSIYDTEGVPICLQCAEAMPDLDGP